jgi:hypothetical protein
MKYLINKRAHVSKVNIWTLSFIASTMLLLSACGEVDKDDGLVLEEVQLPTDSSLTLYCPDAGIADEPCILNDPENPYSITPINDDNKFDLDFATPSAKARFYLWGTAQAISPRGENQYYLARALQEMYTESGSELAKNHAIRAYRSVLDNYFDEVTFFQFPDPPAEGEIFYPKKVRLLSVPNLWAPDPGLNLDPLYDNNLLAWEALGEWGYSYEESTGDVYRNF